MNGKERAAELTPRQGAEDVRAVALLLPGGSVASHRGPMRLALWGLKAPAARLAGAGASGGVAVHLLRYRYRGWNGEEASTAVDAEWALGELAGLYGDVPVAVLGNSLGGRAAFRVGGHRNVVSVTGVAPWLPGEDPVDHLAGRKVLIVHGDKDKSEATPAMSLAFAERARRVTDVCRFEVRGGSHTLLGRAPDVWSLTTDFMLSTLGCRELPAPLVDALAEDGDLRTTLAVGYGR
ncbi:alpha/beta hydrolase [Streptomyces montanisoli]|uniref:alpha/beta hydrolase n=1 Tax=Streptomyces montanisoli TaxID=2798581 RepID=UPI001FD78FD7|nr:alpha/beta hydrolase [Streptomyces montanisoli]